MASRVSVAEAAVLAVADHLEADGDQGLLDGGHGGPVVGAREGAMPGRNPGEARQTGEPRVGERDPARPRRRTGWPAAPDGCRHPASRSRTDSRQLLGATLPLQCATGNRGGCTIAGGSLEADGEPAEGPAVEALDGRRGEVRILIEVARRRPRGARLVPVGRGPLASLDSTPSPWCRLRHAVKGRSGRSTAGRPCDRLRRRSAPGGPMEFIDVVMKRRAVRRFEDGGVDREVIERIARLAQRTPSAGLQPGAAAGRGHRARAPARGRPDLRRGGGTRPTSGRGSASARRSSSRA